MNRSLQHNTLNIKKLFYSACSAGLKTHCFKPLLLHKSWLHKSSISLLKATTKISASPILDEHLVNSNETVDLSGQRCLINVSGKDTIKFLNGLCTAALGTITDSGASLSQISGEKPLVFDLDGLYTVFLNPQGRVFFDAFIYLPKNLSNDSNFSLSHQIENQGLVLDVCMEMKDQVLSHLNRYKLISKVKLEEVSDKFKIVSLSGNQVFQELYPTSFFNNPLDKNMPSSRHLTSGQLNTLGASYGSWDHRWYSPELGIRVLLQKDFQPSNFFGNTIHISKHEYSFYANKLVKLGIAETSRGITSLSSLPMECNLELLNGINFRKGCYVGQELTIRTHHKGVIRKRIIPAKVLNSTNIPSLVGADIYDSNNDNTTKARKKSLGKIIYSSETHILILMRLEVLPSGVSEANLSFEASSENVKEQIDLHITYPPWIQSILNPQ